MRPSDKRCSAFRRDGLPRRAHHPAAGRNEQRRDGVKLISESGRIGNVDVGLVLDFCPRRLQPRWPRGVLSGAVCGRLRVGRCQSISGPGAGAAGGCSARPHLSLRKILSEASRGCLCQAWLLPQAGLCCATQKWLNVPPLGTCCVRHLPAAVNSSARAWQAW